MSASSRHCHLKFILLLFAVIEILQFTLFYHSGTTRLINVIKQYCPTSSQSSSTPPHGRRDASQMWMHIPRLVHFIYLNADNNTMVKAYQADLNSCITKNPDLTFVLWNDWNLKTFVEWFVPPDRAALLHQPADIASRSDIARYLILEQFGGIYMDVDTICERPMYDQYLANETCLLGVEPVLQTRLVHNVNYNAMTNFIACAPKHPFISMLVRNLKSAQQGSSFGWEYTGPMYLTRQYEFYKAAFQQRNNNDPMKTYFPVKLANPRLFHPNLDNEEGFVKKCKTPHKLKEWQRRGCEELQEYIDWYHRPETGGKAQAVMFHHWLHLGYQRREKLRQMPQFAPFDTFPQLHSWPPYPLPSRS